MKHYYNPEVKVQGNVFPMEKFIKYEEDTYDVLGSIFLENVQKVVSQEGEAKVFENECRFDVMAYKYMQEQTDYWWVLMEYNNFIDWNLKGNDILKIPDMSDLMMFEQELVLRYNVEQMDN